MRDPIDVFFGKPEPAPYPGSLAPKNRVDDDTNNPINVVDTLSSREYLIDGVPAKFYTVGSLAKVLGRSPVTIRSWEAKGWLPAASFRSPAPKSQQIPGKSPKGSRLYSRQQIDFLVDAFYHFRLDQVKGHDWPGFKRHIQDNYPRK
jgi:hypothetical protein